MGMMDQDILKVLYTEKQIAARIEAMGMEMYDALKDKDPLFVSVLRGAFIFMADIVRACQVRCDVEFIAVSSYGNATSSSGAVKITHDIQQDITGRNIVVIEDILDSGNTSEQHNRYKPPEDYSGGFLYIVGCPPVKRCGKTHLDITTRR